MTETRSAGLFAKVIQLYELIDHVDKAGKNTAQGYSYVRAVDVARTIREAAVKVGLAIVPSVDDIEIIPAGTTRSGTQQYLTTVRGTLAVYDPETQASLLLSGVGQGIDTGDKGAYKAITGMVKYCLRNLALIPDEADDPEVERADERPAPKRATRVVGAPATSEEPATAAQKRLIRAKAAEAKLNEDQLHMLLFLATAKNSSKQLVKSDIDKLVAAFDDEALLETCRTAQSVESTGETE